MSTSFSPPRASAPPSPPPPGPPPAPAARRPRPARQPVTGRWADGILDAGAAYRPDPVLDGSGPVARALRAVVIPGLAGGGGLIWLLGVLMLAVSVTARNEPEATASFLAVVMSLLCLCLSGLFLLCLLACHLVLRRRRDAVFTATAGGAVLAAQLVGVVVTLILVT